MYESKPWIKTTVSVRFITCVLGPVTAYLINSYAVWHMLTQSGLNILCTCILFLPIWKIKIPCLENSESVAQQWTQFTKNIKLCLVYTLYVVHRFENILQQSSNRMFSFICIPSHHKCLLVILLSLYRVKFYVNNS